MGLFAERELRSKFLCQTFLPVRRLFVLLCLQIVYIKILNYRPRGGFDPPQTRFHLYRISFHENYCLGEHNISAPKFFKLKSHYIAARPSSVLTSAERLKTLCYTNYSNKTKLFFESLTVVIYMYMPGSCEDSNHLRENWMRHTSDGLGPLSYTCTLSCRHLTGY